MHKARHGQFGEEVELSVFKQGDRTLGDVSDVGDSFDTEFETLAPTLDHRREVRTLQQAVRLEPTGVVVLPDFEGLATGIARPLRPDPRVLRRGRVGAL